jgi:RimJ/RimL family protein N-acetyltransferase
VIETERLLLRPLERADIDTLAGFYADADFRRYLTGGGRALPEEKAIALIERMLQAFDEDGFGQLAVVRTEDGALLGRCGLTEWQTRPWKPTTRAQASGETVTEIGWKLGAAYWGRGYATEAALAVRDDSFARLGLQRLVALIHPRNVASVRVAEKIGMAPAGGARIGLGRAVVYAVSADTP